MTPAVDPNRRYTLAEYHALAAAGGRLEYWEGKVTPAPAGNERHEQIVRNGRRALAVRLAGSGYDLLARAAGVRVTAGRSCHPDLAVTGSTAAPLLLAEVYSPETEVPDRADRFAGYREIGDLREYLLVAQDRPRVEGYDVDADGTWLIRRPVDGLDGVIHLRALGLDLPLAEVYAGVAFPPLKEPKWLFWDEGTGPKGTDPA